MQTSMSVYYDSRCTICYGLNRLRATSCRATQSPLLISSGLEPAILNWYGHCSMNKLGGSGGMLPQENFKIRHSEIASEAMFGPKCY